MEDRQILVGVIVVGVVLFAGLIAAGLGVPGDVTVGSTTTDGSATGTPTSTAPGPTTARSETTDAEEDDADPTDGGTTSAETTTVTDETATATTTPRTEYGFTIDNIEECGTTCREVTVTLRNNRDETREDVVVETTMLADGEVVWEGRQDVGTLGPGASVTDTKTVDVGLAGGFAIRQNDGYVTIRTTVTSASGSVTYEERRQVA